MPVTKKLKKEIKPEIVQEVLEIPQKTYKMEVSFNDQTYNFETDNINDALELINPFNIKTRVYFKIYKGDKMYEKIMNAFQAKQIFRNKLYRFIFVNRIIFK